MSYQTDLDVYGPSGELVLGVEVKSRCGTDAKWAAEVHRNLAVHGFIPPSPYFLLALPDRFYLWTRETAGDPDAAPTFEVDAAPLLAPYFRAAKLRPEDIRGPGQLEFVVFWLLHDLVEGPPAAQSQKERWLVDSGLLDSLRGGRVAYEAAG